jgi:LmbE family N-acetylglucosaminyl deacetylase
LKQPHVSRTLHVGRTHDWDLAPMLAAILSPHLDDAVLSCWHVLSQPGEVIVINVFAGVPTSRGAPAWWDRVTGASDSVERVRERVEEDRKALALAGRAPVNLGFLDEQYRDAEQSLAPVTAEIEARLLPGAHVLAPAAFGGHADHVLVRSAALQLRSNGFAVSLYADLPHAWLDGWPGWVTGSDTAPSSKLAEAAWDRALAKTGVPASAMSREIHELDPNSIARKREAVHAYVTQLDGLAEFTGRALTDRESLGYEVLWKLPIPATPWPARGRSRATPRP